MTPDALSAAASAREAFEKRSMPARSEFRRVAVFEEEPRADDARPANDDAAVDLEASEDIYKGWCCSVKNACRGTFFFRVLDEPRATLLHALPPEKKCFYSLSRSRRSPQRSRTLARTPASQSSARCPARPRTLTCLSTPQTRSTWTVLAMELQCVCRRSATLLGSSPLMAGGGVMMSSIILMRVYDAREQ
jgi:hypothetical protein